MVAALRDGFRWLPDNVRLIVTARSSLGDNSNHQHILNSLAVFDPKMLQLPDFLPQEQLCSQLQARVRKMLAPPGYGRSPDEAALTAAQMLLGWAAGNLMHCSLLLAAVDQVRPEWMLVDQVRPEWMLVDQVRPEWMLVELAVCTSLPDFSPNYHDDWACLQPQTLITVTGLASLHPIVIVSLSLLVIAMCLCCNIYLAM